MDSKVVLSRPFLVPRRLGRTKSERSAAAQRVREDARLPFIGAVTGCAPSAGFPERGVIVAEAPDAGKKMRQDTSEIYRGNRNNVEYRKLRP
jgi:hypothetical protein